MFSANGGYTNDAFPSSMRKVHPTHAAFAEQNSMSWMEFPEELQVHTMWQRKPVCQGEQPVHFVRQRAPACCTVNEDGLEGNRTWNNALSDKDKSKGKPKAERAVLLQCQENYSELSNQFPEYADHFREAEAPFGEQIVVSGMDASTICIGDLFASDHSSLELKVTYPRLPCFRVDKRYPLAQQPGLRSGELGTVRQSVGANGTGGFFCSVQRPGDVTDGDTLKLVQRPCPGWTLQRLSQMCYGTTPIRMAWDGSDAELKELCELDELGTYEWQERLINIRASILQERPLVIPDWLGYPLLQEEGENLILGTWKMVGGDEEYVELVLSDDGQITSTKPQFGGLHFTAKLQEEEEDYTLEVQMGSTPMMATMNGFGPAGGRALLVFSSGCMWSWVGQELDGASELSIRSCDTRYPNSLSLRSGDSRYPNSWSRSSNDRKYTPGTVADLFFPSQ